MSDDMKKTIWDIVSTVLYLVCVMCVTWLFITFVGQRTIVDGSSMEPTLHDKDNLIVDKISYRFSDPKRFDVVVFPFKYTPDTLYIKRIIGLPGETVQIGEDGTIYINGEVLEENFGREIINPSMRGRAAEPVTLGENEYFVMGDNRNNSSDSRTEAVGNVSKDEFIGRAWVRFWPVSQFGKVRH